MFVRVLRSTTTLLSSLFRQHQSRARFFSPRLLTVHTMPPKMRATRSKRKLEESSSDHDHDEENETQPEGRSTRSVSPVEEEVKTQSTSRTSSKSQSQNSGKRQLKRAKTEGSSSGIFENEQPTNTALPESIEFAVKNEGCLRIAAWNITSLASSQKKGFKRYVDAEDADILVLSETKVNNEPVDPSLTARYPHRYWAISAKKGYAGTAILSKRKALSVDYTLPGHPDPKYTKGRIITLEFEGSYLVGTYVPNAGVGLKTLGEKNLWNTHFEAYIRDLDKKKPVIWTGDLNVAPTELDLRHPKPNWNKTPGYTEAETSSFGRILNTTGSDPAANVFVDVWRRLHPENRQFTYFSYRFACRGKGVGWRIDHFVLSERLIERVKMCEIRSEIYGASDHCPITLEIEGEL